LNVNHIVASGESWHGSIWIAQWFFWLLYDGNMSMNERIDGCSPVGLGVHVWNLGDEGCT
jgi:hypothetical protein